MSLKTNMSGWLRKIRGGGSPVTGEVMEFRPVPPPPELHPRPRGGLLSLLPGAKRDAAIAELRRGYDEVILLTRSMRTHMERQGERGDRLLDIMERLPAALQALPETNRNQVRMLEAIQVHLEQYGKQSGKLNEAIITMANATRHQSQVLDAMHQQFEATRDNEQQHFESMNVMNSTLQRMSVSSDASVDTLRHISESGQRSEHRMADLIERNTQHMTKMMIASGVLIFIALSAVAYAIFVLSRKG